MLNLLFPKLAGVVGKIGKAAASAHALTAPKRKPAPRPAPKKPAPKVIKVAAKKPVTVLPPAPRPVVLPKKADTVRVLGMDVPKPVAYIGGTALGVAAVLGIAKAVR